MILFITTTLIVIGFLIRASIRPKNFPPGPRGLPFLGYLPFLPRQPMPIYSAMPELSRRYGPVVGFFLGPSQPIITVCSREVAKEALMNADLDGRPDHFNVTNVTFGEKLGLLVGDGETYFEQRNFLIRHLSMYNSQYEERITDAVNEIVHTIDAQLMKLNPESTVNFENAFFAPIVNILWELLTGRRLSSEDTEFQKIISNLKQFNQTLNQCRLFTPLPSKLLKILPFLKKRCGSQADLVIPLQELIQADISLREEARSSPDFKMSCFIDCYLEEINKRTFEKSEHNSFNVKQLAAILQDLFIGSCLPVAYMIGFALLHLVARPDVQQKVQEELDEICKHSRPNLSHRSRLPYTDAVLIECQRLSSVAPTTLPHRALADTQIKGYHVPKDTFVFVQLKEPFADSSSLWNDPEILRPERHLTLHDGKFALSANDLMTPYSIGNRACLGKTLANNTYFLAVCHITKAYNLRSAMSDGLIPTLDPVGNFVSEYQGFEILATPRITHSSSCTVSNEI